MHFVADESCDFAVVRALRMAGYDVVAIAEISPRLGDDEVLRLARDGEGVLLTEDKDFGELVYGQGQESCGVLLFRFPAGTRAAMARAAVDAVDKMDDRLASRFLVIQPGRIRAGRSRGNA